MLSHEGMARPPFVAYRAASRPHGVTPTSRCYRIPRAQSAFPVIVTPSRSLLRVARDGMCPRFDRANRPGVPTAIEPIVIANYLFFNYL